MNPALAVILLAAGNSSRFHSNKLLTMVNGIPMYQHTIQWAAELNADLTVVVTQYEEMAKALSQKEFMVQKNSQSQRGISFSIRLGLTACLEKGGFDGYLFSVCDQPYLTLESVRTLIRCWQISSKGIACLSWKNQLGNPVIFDKKYVPELLALKGDVGGKAILKRNPHDVCLVPALFPRELFDIDRTADLKQLPGCPV